MVRTVSLEKASMVWDEYFNSTKANIFKCEVLQDYSAVDMGPSLRAWLDGNQKLSKRLMIEEKEQNEWGKDYRTKPVTKTRVHVVSYPLTSYLEWEIVSYQLNTWNEQIYLVNRDKLIGIEVPLGDFWIFDDRCAVEYIYSGPNGMPVGGKIYESQEDAARLVACKASLLARAKSISG